MYKQIFDKSNGKPKLIESVVDEDTNESYFDYDQSIYTDIMPESGLYQPIYFRDGEWHGLTKEQWQKRQADDEPYIPSNVQIQLGKTQFEVFKMQRVVDELREENKQIKEEINTIKGGN